eukprot:CAMPEP_0197850566 /NCGR_PEP_ID=MMETSP1438-20131217/15731_1 /TAXON_ID=1461541 /ORGANISM="Pterosperma sp., Strain CCMP1384" /LENGTH=177 /DNA_ID=CAMNT_0043463789 /DNA_START=54 /DNA_END=584 /DNA_ORIENTATION=+
MVARGRVGAMRGRANMDWVRTHQRYHPYDDHHPYNGEGPPIIPLVVIVMFVSFVWTVSAPVNPRYTVLVENPACKAALALNSSSSWDDIHHQIAADVVPIDASEGGNYTSLRSRSRSTNSNSSDYDNAHDARSGISDLVLGSTNSTTQDTVGSGRSLPNITSDCSEEFLVKGQGQGQ